MLHYKANSLGKRFSRDFVNSAPYAPLILRLFVAPVALRDFLFGAWIGAEIRIRDLLLKKHTESSHCAANLKQW